MNLSKSLAVTIKKNKFLINIKPISIRDYLLFEEKKIEPGDIGSTPLSVGLINAIRWFFPKYVTVHINDGPEQILTETLLNMYNFDVLHLMRIMSTISKIEGDVILLDDVEDISDSDDFIYNFDNVEYHVHRREIPWSETPKFLKSQKGNRTQVNIFKMNIDFIKQYFTVNDRSITDEDIDSTNKIPIEVYLLMVQRLGKCLTA